MYSLFLNFSTVKRKKKGSRASAFIAENGIKAQWKRACGFPRVRREDKENGCRSSRANLPLDPPSTKQRTVWWLYFLSRRVVWKPTRKPGVGERVTCGAGRKRRKTYLCCRRYRACRMSVIKLKGLVALW